MKKVLILFTVFIGSICSSNAQSELPKFASSVDKIKVKLDMPLEGRAYKNGTGYTLNPKMLDALPKKVALVSFYTFDPGFTKIWKYSTTSYKFEFSDNDYNYYSKNKTTTTHTTKRNSKGNAGPIALGFYYNAIGTLKSKFKEMGMDLLEPVEFLDTPEKRAFYDNFEITRSKFNDFVSKLNFNGGHDALWANPEGFKVMSIGSEPYANYTRKGMLSTASYKKNVADGQLLVMSKIGKEVTSINELTTALGVDAVVFLYSTIYVPKETEIHLQNVNLLMFGPNPVPLPTGKDKKFNYFPGQMYVGARANIGVPILKINKKKIETQQLNFDGYSNIIEAMTNRIQTYFNKAFAKK